MLATDFPSLKRDLEVLVRKANTDAPSLALRSPASLNESTEGLGAHQKMGGRSQRARSARGGDLGFKANGGRPGRSAVGGTGPSDTLGGREEMQGERRENGEREKGRKEEAGQPVLYSGGKAAGRALPDQGELNSAGPTPERNLRERLLHQNPDHHFRRQGRPLSLSARRCRAIQEKRARKNWRQVKMGLTTTDGRRMGGPGFGIWI